MTDPLSWACEIAAKRIAGETICAVFGMKYPGILKYSFATIIILIAGMVFKAMELITHGST